MSSGPYLININGRSFHQLRFDELCPVQDVLLMRAVDCSSTYKFTVVFIYAVCRVYIYIYDISMLSIISRLHFGYIWGMLVLYTMHRRVYMYMLYIFEQHSLSISLSLCASFSLYLYTHLFRELREGHLTQHRASYAKGTTPHNTTHTDSCT